MKEDVKTEEVKEAAREVRRQLEREQKKSLDFQERLKNILDWTRIGYIWPYPLRVPTT